MTKKQNSENFMKRARAWATKQGLFGAQAFLRYVMFSYLEALNQVSEEFVFKGGNLLWFYIHTPRATVDMDFATLHLKKHEQVREALESACSAVPGIQFKILKFTEINQTGKLGATVTLTYKTDQGASNQFGLDIVYGIPTDFEELESPLLGSAAIRAATIENIIADKLATAQRFAGGNSRIKDFDDLWRLSKTETEIDSKRLRKLLKGRNVEPELDLDWISPEMERAWASHRKRYKDLPEKIEEAFGEINSWLAGLISLSKG